METLWLCLTAIGIAILITVNMFIKFNKESRAWNEERKEVKILAEGAARKC